MQEFLSYHPRRDRGYDTPTIIARKALASSESDGHSILECGAERLGSTLFARALGSRFRHMFERMAYGQVASESQTVVRSNL